MATKQEVERFLNDFKTKMSKSYFTQPSTQ
jgi:hypothetical protein